MDWPNERYVRVYVRDTVDYLVLSWQARGLWLELLRKADRAGVIATTKGARGIAVLVRWPAEVVEPAIAELLEDGCLQSSPAGYVIPRFMEAQECAMSDVQRKREQRDRRRSEFTNRDPEVTERTELVTKRDRMSQVGHAESRRVTPSLTVPNRTVPYRTEKGGDSASPRPPRAPSGDHQHVIAAFTAYYERTHGGSRPTWDAKAAGQVKALLSKQPRDEICRRLELAEISPPKFPPAPYDLAAFVQHFDKFTASAPARDVRYGSVAPMRHTDYQEGDVLL